MVLSPHPMRSHLISYLKNLRKSIISAFEIFESEKTFSYKYWDYKEEGGGEIALIRDGQNFEKGAVNWSGVGGCQFPMGDGKGSFFATGISLITHMCNPHAPTVHMNLRFIETTEGHWFGGGYDLTPMGFPYQEDKDHFHRVAKESLLPFGNDLYDKFSRNAQEYFFIPHRKKERGEGGLFFDHYNTGNFEADRAMWEGVGNSFLKAILPIYNRRLSQPFSQEDREKQLECRAHYAEFNLMYDRGTKFGFQSGGNPEAILCSMPPLAKW